LLARHLILGAIFGLFVHQLFGQSPVTTIRVPVHLVTVPTLVFANDDRLVSGLEAKDFHVFDNGRRQNAALDITDPPVSVAIAIQASQDVRDYVSFISKVGSVLGLVGEICG
jgi:hypothetical protein